VSGCVFLSAPICVHLRIKLASFVTVFTIEDRLEHLSKEPSEGSADGAPSN
jgi:hypothetical protein